MRVADVFVSYKRQDEGPVGRLVKALRDEGLSVWWDRDIPPHAPWEETIEREHTAAGSLVVCWSKASVASENVKAEARRAKAQNRFVQVFLEPCEPPMFFGERQGVDISDWTGKRDDPRFKNVVEAVRAILEGRAAEQGVGLGVPVRRKVPKAVVAAAAVTVLAGGAVVFGLLGREEPATPVPAAAPVQPADPALALRQAERRQLAALEGQWGASNSCEAEHRYRYAVAWDPASALHRISVSGEDDYLSVAEVVSVRNGLVNTRALSPPSDEGRSAELSVAQGALVINTPGADAAIRMIRCPVAASG